MHTSPFSNAPSNTSAHYFYIVINQGSRFAVPFFFIISGYFFAKKMQGGGLIVPVSLAIIKRLFVIWSFWSLIYLLPFNLSWIFRFGFENVINYVTIPKLTYFASNPLRFIFDGKNHLWYLVSLNLAVIITALYLRYWPSRSLDPLIIFAIILYSFGLCTKAYSATSIGIHFDFNTRNGPFFSLIFFVTGFVLSLRQISPKYLTYGIAIMLSGYALHFAEIYYLYSVYHVSPVSHDYVLGTYFTGLGAALIALSNHSLLDIRYASKFGQYTLGVYAIHIFFLVNIKQISRNLSGTLGSWGLGVVLMVLVLSFISTIAMSKFKPLKKVIV